MIADSPLVQRVAPSPNFGDRRGRNIDSIVLHYTGMPSGDEALARLVDPAAGVSCHYLVWEDGRVDQLVAERERAWHAGRSCWAGERDMNALSIGIEIVNSGHEGGCPPYPEAQINALIALGRDCQRRHAIAPRRVLAHSDIAPDRKIDPGEWFPWPRLAREHLGIVITPAPLAAGPVLQEGDAGPAVAALRVDLARLGYDIAREGPYDGAMAAVVAAFQRHFRPERVDGMADSSTRTTLAALLQAVL